MPVILRPEFFAEWLDPKSDPERLTDLLRPYPADDREMWEVGDYVRYPRKFDGPECEEAV